MNAQVVEVGATFGSRTIIAEAPRYHNPKGYTSRRWLCRCVCGREKVHSTGTLLARRACQGCSNEWRRKEGTPFRRIIDSYKRSAAKRHLKWALPYADTVCLFKAPCHYCGTAPQNCYQKDRANVLYSGIDRVDNTQGYEVGNVVSCCHTCNAAKGKIGYAEFVAWLDQVATFRVRLSV